MNIKNGAYAPTPKACLEKVCVLLLALQQLSTDLVLMTGLEVLLWTM